MFAYTQSDEISVLYTDFGSLTTQPWFGGVVAKQVSIAAALATAELNSRRPGKRALFDARVFTLADPVEVANYFLWRQRDAVRNSISMAAQARFSHRELHGVNTGRMQEMLWSEHGINWNDYPDGFKRGRVTVRQVGEREVEYTDRRSQETVRTTAVRSWWQTSGAPHFTTEPDGWLAATIPARRAWRWHRDRAEAHAHRARTHDHLVHRPGRRHHRRRLDHLRGDLGQRRTPLLANTAAIILKPEAGPEPRRLLVLLGPRRTAATPHRQLRPRLVPPRQSHDPTHHRADWLCPPGRTAPDQQ